MNTLFWAVPMYLYFLLKHLIPSPSWKKYWSDKLHHIGENWSLYNKKIVDHTKTIRWDIQGVPPLSRDKWYFIASNHQSWSDIMVITYIFGGKIPFIKYFVKDTLKYFPIIGIAWSAFEFPMMKRHSSKKLAKHPELRSQDIETTLTLCKKYLRKPSTILSFVEGTRFTKKKHKKQQSPFQHMLKPKPGGVALSIKALKDHIDHLIQVTIIYPKGHPTFWQFMCGDVRDIKVIINHVPIPEKFKTGDYANDPIFREEIKIWLNNIWEKADQEMQTHYAATPKLAKSNQTRLTV